jgi:hypothetical protein
VGKGLGRRVDLGGEVWKIWEITSKRVRPPVFRTPPRSKGPRGTPRIIPPGSVFQLMRYENILLEMKKELRQYLDNVDWLKPCSKLGRHQLSIHDT